MINITWYIKSKEYRDIESDYQVEKREHFRFGVVKQILQRGPMSPAAKWMSMDASLKRHYVVEAKSMLIGVGRKKLPRLLLERNWNIRCERAFVFVPQSDCNVTSFLFWLDLILFFDVERNGWGILCYSSSEENCYIR